MVLQLDESNCESEKNMAHLNVCLHSMKMLRKILENDYVTTRTLCPNEETNIEKTDANDVKRHK